MEELSLHIEYLLHRHDCLVLPGVGALLVTTIAPSVAPDMSHIMPPRREICFNPSLRRTDGMLAVSYARRLGIGFEAAESMVEGLMADIISRLEKGDTVSLGKAGMLTPGNGGAPVYSPSSALTLDTRHLGPICLDPAEQNPQIVPEKTVMEDEGCKFDTAKNYYIAINKTFARTAAIFCLVMLAAMSVYFPANNYKNNTILTDRAAVVPVTEIAKSIKEVNKTDTVETSGTPAVASGPESGRYYLIVASLRSLAEANRFAAARPTDSLQIIGGKKIHRVYAARSDNRDSLLSVMRAPAFRTKYADAWIWTP